MSWFVVLLARFGEAFHQRRIPVLPKLISLLIRIVFSCHISPGARIGKGTVLAYGGLGIVIHGDCVIGRDVNIGTGVVLGGNFLRGGVPVVEDDVFIASGAKILGPVRIGKGSVIGANSVVTTDIPSGSVYAGVPARKIRNVVED